MAGPEDLSFRERQALGFLGPERYFETQKLWQEKAHRDEYQRWTAQVEEEFKNYDAIASAASARYDEMLDSGGFTNEELFRVRQQADRAVNKIGMQKMDYLTGAAATNSNPLIKNHATQAVQSFMDRIEMASKQSQQVLDQYEGSLSADERLAGEAQERELGGEAGGRAQDIHGQQMGDLEQGRELRGQAGARAEDIHGQQMQDLEQGRGIRGEEHSLRQRQGRTSAERGEFELGASRYDRALYEGSLSGELAERGKDLIDRLEQFNVPEEKIDEFVAEATGERFTSGELRDLYGGIDERRKSEIADLKNRFKRAEARGDTDQAQLFDHELKRLESQDDEQAAKRVRKRQVKEDLGTVAGVIYDFRTWWNENAPDSPGESVRKVSQGAGAEVRPDRPARAEARKERVEQKYGRDLY